MQAPRRNPERILERLEWTVIRRLDGLLQGDYRSLFRGFGLDLAGLREYQYQDDIRQIDWNVTARLGEPYVRLFNEDREITAWLLLDLSPSVDFGSGGVRKRDRLIELAAIVARLLTRHGNRVGAVFFGGKAEQAIPPRGGRRHVLHVLTSLLAQPELAESPPTDLDALLRNAGRIMRRRSLVFVVSDFFSATPWTAPLGRLALRHELVGVRLNDPLETELPDAGFILMRDAETGEDMLVDTHDRGFRARFAELAARREAEIRSNFRRAGVDVLELSTAENPVASIVRFIEARKRGRKI